MCTGALTSGAVAPRDMLNGSDKDGSEDLEGFMAGIIGAW